MERVEFLEGVNRKEDKAWNELYQYSMPLYVVIPPGLPGTRMPQKTLYKDVWSASGILPSVSGRSKLLPPIFTVLFTTLHSILYDLSKEPGDFTKNGWIGSSKMRKKEWQWL